MNPITALLVALGVLTAVFVASWGSIIVKLRGDRGAAATPAADARAPTPLAIGVGAVTNFFDTLGIGSFAPTTTLYRVKKTIDDRLIPGTLNIGHTIPTFAEAYIFIDKVAVDPRTLVTMISAATLGAIFGAPVVARLPRPRVQLGMGLALLLVFVFLIWRQIGLPQDGTKTGLTGVEFYVAVGANFVFGALMTIGVGLYAPCLVVVSLLGMNPKAGFPIMMGSCAFLQALGSIPFIRQRSFAPGASVGLSLGGVPAVLVAAFIVKDLPLYWVKWLIAVVVIYTAVMLLRAARRA